MPSFGITGASGVLGSRIIAKLIDLRFPIETFQGDIRERSEVARWVNSTKCDIYIHAAAIVPVVAVENDLSRAIDVNVIGTSVLVSEVEKIGSKFVYISSSHVYQTSEQALSEASACLPSSVYGLTKYQGEQWVRQLATKPLILRIFSFFDENQDSAFLVPSLAKKILTAGPEAKINLSGIDSQRDIASASYCADAIVRLSLEEVSGVVNVGTNEATSVGQIAQKLSISLGRRDVQFIGQPNDIFNTIVADTTLMSGLIPELPSFSLESSFSTFSRNFRDFLSIRTQESNSNQIEES